MATCKLFFHCISKEIEGAMDTTQLVWSVWCALSHVYLDWEQLLCVNRLNLRKVDERKNWFSIFIKDLLSVITACSLWAWCILSLHFLTDLSLSHSCFSAVSVLVELERIDVFGCLIADVRRIRAVVLWKHWRCFFALFWFNVFIFVLVFVNFQKFKLLCCAISLAVKSFFSDSA